MIGDKNFEIEQLNNDIKARNLQIQKQDERIIQFINEVDKLKSQNESDKKLFESETKRINEDNLKQKRLILAMKMREMNTSKIVSNAEGKIREQHEIREKLIKTIKNQESENVEMGSKLKQRTMRYDNLKQK